MMESSVRQSLSGAAHQALCKDSCQRGAGVTSCHQTPLSLSCCIQASLPALSHLLPFSLCLSKLSCPSPSILRPLCPSSAERRSTAGVPHPCVPLPAPGLPTVLCSHSLLGLPKHIGLSSLSGSLILLPPFISSSPGTASWPKLGATAPPTSSQPLPQGCLRLEPG